MITGQPANHNTGLAIGAPLAPAPGSLHRERAHRLRAAALAAAAAAAFLLALLAGCVSTSEGIAREQRVISVATNAISILEPVAHAAPSPAGPALEGLLAAAGGLLALWSGYLHRKAGQLATEGKVDS